MRLSISKSNFLKIIFSLPFPLGIWYNIFTFTKGGGTYKKNKNSLSKAEKSHTLQNNTVRSGVFGISYTDTYSSI